MRGIIYLAKHLQGQHDQKRHGSRKASFVLGSTKLNLSKAGMVTPDKLPPPKKGHIRLFTTLDNSKGLESVEDKGLLTSFARELEFSGKIIWATGGPKDYSDARALVAFDIEEGKAKQVNRTDFTIGSDITPANIVATYPMVTWSKNKGDIPLRWDKVLETVEQYGKERILRNSSVSDDVKRLIE